MWILIGLLAIALQPHIPLVCATDHVVITRNCTCPAIFDPVCGSDTVTYSSACVLKCVSDDNVCKGLPPIHVVQDGPCPRNDCDCQPFPNLLCGTDDRTYLNDCYLAYINRIRQALGLRPIGIQYRGACKAPQIVCSNEIAPLCGNDGRTYRNYCYLRSQSLWNQLRDLPPILIYSIGACRVERCICPENIDPVCGSDGVTYNNVCAFECQRRRLEQLGQRAIWIVNRGPCRVECKCDKRFDPVCSSDGKTYGNICLFNCENLRRKSLQLPLERIVSKGECGCSCLDVYDPVCASDGKTYRNAYELRCKNRIREIYHLPPLKQLYKGECRRCNCPLNIQLVCGSNGITYTNPCFINCENSIRLLQGLPLLTYTNGPCRCSCNFVYDPVCGTDALQYFNPCTLDCVNQRRKAANLPPIGIRLKGRCSSSSCSCPDIYDPVCASDNKSYPNRCALGCENKRRKDEGLQPLWVIWEGPCPCNCNCPNTKAEVCGSDGKTYRNACILHCTSRFYCQICWPAIFYVRDGSC